jgi:mRNA interferase MazF
VVQNDIGNQFSPTTFVAALTARTKGAYPFHVSFTAEESGMKQDGTVLLEQIITVDRSRLRRKRGKLSVERMKEVAAALKVSLDLP